MFCEYCGKQIADSAKFCEFCGKKVLSIESIVPKEDNPREKNDPIQTNDSRQQEGYSQSNGGYSQPNGGYSQPNGGYSQPGGGYSQPGMGYAQPGGSNARKASNTARTSTAKKRSGVPITATPEMRILGIPVRGKGIWIAIAVIAVVVLGLFAFTKLSGNSGDPAEGAAAPKTEAADTNADFDPGKSFREKQTEAVEKEIGEKTDQANEAGEAESAPEAAEPTPEPTPEPVVLTGWQQDEGAWRWYTDGGEMAVNGWRQIDGSWYYFDAEGRMATGWLALDGAWYYLDDNGHMVTGWLMLDGNWYYFNDSGVMVTGEMTEGDTRYRFNDSGVMVESEPLHAAPVYDETTVGRTEDTTEFEWQWDVRENGIPADAVMLTDPADISGRWKGFNIYDDHGDMVGVEFLNVDIMAGEGAATVVYDWYKIAWNDSPYLEDETDMDDIYFYPSFQDGTMYGGSDYGNLDLYAFWQLGQKQYGLGELMLPDGGMVYLALVRP